MINSNVLIFETRHLISSPVHTDSGVVVGTVACLTELTSLWRQTCSFLIDLGSWINLAMGSRNILGSKAGCGVIHHITYWASVLYIVNQSKDVEIGPFSVLFAKHIENVLYRCHGRFV